VTDFTSNQSGEASAALEYGQDEPAMRLQDIAPYLGRRCQMMVECPVCGGTHVHEGTLGVARQPGEVEVAGHAYSLGQIRALTPAPGAEPLDRTLAIPRPLFDLVWQAGLLLLGLSAARILAR
jgi:hypothetical protein